MEGGLDLTGALQQGLPQEPQQEQPLAAMEEPEEEELRKRLIAVGVMDIDKRLGGGLPPKSVTLVEGDPDAGKSIVVQQLGFGALKEGLSVDIFLAEGSTREYLQQMDSLGMSTTDYYLLGQLSLYRADLRVDREKAERILRHLIRHIQDCGDRDLFIIDSITSLLFQFDEPSALQFLATCNDLASRGRTIIPTLHSYAMTESLRLRASTIVDAHLRLRIEELGDQLVRTLEVAKIRGAVKTNKNTVSFTVQSGFGLKSVPISKTKA